MVDGIVFTANAVRFGRLLRRAGLEVESGQTATFLRALCLLGFDRRADVRAAGRAIFVRRWEDRAAFDAAFDLFWRRRGNQPDARLPRIAQRERFDYCGRKNGSSAARSRAGVAGRPHRGHGSRSAGSDCGRTSRRGRRKRRRHRGAPDSEGSRN